MGLQSRLLAGLAVLVFLAIPGAGYLALSATRAHLTAADTERALAVGAAAASVLGDLVGPDEGSRERLRVAAGNLLGIGGASAVTVLDVRGTLVAGAVVVGVGEGEARLRAALGGAVAEAARSAGGEAIDFVGPLRRQGAIAGALRLRFTPSPDASEAIGDSTRLLLALTLVYGGLILLFGALFLRRLVAPLEALARAAGRVAGGDLDVPPVEAKGAGEVSLLADAFGRMTSSLREQKLRLAAQQEQLLAQEKLATVGRLAAGVAHEIGNPLTAVLGYVELLAPGLDDEKDPAARDLLQRIKTETGRIHRIVHDLLDYARPAAEAIEPVSLKDTVAAAIDLLGPQPRLRGVTVESDIAADLPPAAASGRRLLQVVLNLLLNAADASAGSGTIRIEARLERESDGAAPPRLFLDVKDEGPGVPEADRAHIFDPFFTTKDPGQGTGLGLAVCRSIVQAAGGAIDLVPPSANERGARFRVTLPAWRGPSSSRR